MPENEPLYNLIIAAGQRAGLVVDHESMKNRQPAQENYPLLTDAVFFTLRPLIEYRRNFRPSWTDMAIKAIAVNEWGDDALGVALVFEAQYNLAMITSNSSDDSAIVTDDLLGRIVDFTDSYPNEAARMFVIPFQWQMNLAGEIIYEPDEDEYPVLDYDMFPTLEVHVEVIEYATEEDFDQALATVSDDSAMGQAIQEMMERLALFFRWLDTETPPRPPRLGEIYH